MSLLTVNMKDFLYNTVYNASLIPFQVAVTTKCVTDAVVPEKLKKKNKTTSSTPEVKEEVPETKQEPPKTEAKKEELKQEEPKKENQEKKKEEFDKQIEKNVEFIKNRKELKNAEKEFDVKTNKETEISIESSIKDDSNYYLIRANLLDRNKAAMKLVSYAMYFMTNSKAQIISNFSDEEKQIVNGVSEMFGFGLIYEDQEAADLYKYDMNSILYNRSEKFLLNVEKDVAFRLHDRMIMDMITRRMKELGRGFIEGTATEIKSEVIVEESKPEAVKEEDQSIKQRTIREEPIIPITFTIIDKKDDSVNVNKSNPEPNFNPNKYSTDLPKEQQEELDKVFADMLKDKYYRYYTYHNTTYLRIFKDMKDYCDYIIDNKTILGGSTVALGVSVGKEIIFIPVNCWKNLVQKILNDSTFVPTNAEVEKIRLEYFDDESIYTIVDMSNTEFLDDLKLDQFNMLGDKLSGICELNRQKYPTCGGVRLRFESYTNNDNFVLVSDDKTISPMPSAGMTTSYHMNGKLKYVVNGDFVTEIDNGIETKYNLNTISTTN